MSESLSYQEVSKYPKKYKQKKPRRITKWSGDRQSTEKRIQSKDSKDDPKPQKKKRGKDQEDTRKVFQKPRSTKEQTNADEQDNNWSEKNSLEEINSRITEAEK